MTSGPQIELGKKPEAQAISFLILCLLAFCKAGEHIDGAFNTDPLPLVWPYFLYLQALLEGSGILQ